jgi:hypothetical protein
MVVGIRHFEQTVESFVDIAGIAFQNGFYNVWRDIGKHIVKRSSVVEGHDGTTIREKASKGE